MARNLKSTKVPQEDLSLTNRVYVNQNDFDFSRSQVIQLEVNVSGLQFIFTASPDPTNRVLKQGEIGFSAFQRKWANITLAQDVQVNVYAGPGSTARAPLPYVAACVLEVDLFNKKNLKGAETIDTELLAREFTMQFVNQAISVGQTLAFSMDERKVKVLTFTVKEIDGIPPNMRELPQGQSLPKVRTGIIMANSSASFDKGPDAPVILTGKCKGKNAFTPIINPDWDFQQLGVGGLDKEFSTVFRRAFASRVFPPDVVQQLGLKHVRGVLLFGPPGTGKTLMARQIAKMLNARTPKIVSGPEILDKYVGESEANIRKLFAEAEEEEKRMAVNSGLHIIIFDEIDAICKQRGSVAGAAGVHDTVVNQLLAKMDGVDQLNNVLIIGMTNRKDMIDEALLRPGRFEVQMEIGLPNEEGRLQILKIHTKKLSTNKKLAQDVSLEELAGLTKNFSGAEIEGLCRAATTIAMNRHIKAIPRIEVDPDGFDHLSVTRADFMTAFEHDVKPAFGTRQEDLAVYLRGPLIQWGPTVKDIMDELRLFANNLRTSTGTGTTLVSVLLEGLPQTGKTALAAWLGKECEYPYTKFVSPSNMVGFSETAKCAMIKKVFDDAYKSPLSCIILDDIEFLLDYSPVGPRYSNLVLQALLVLFKNVPPSNRKLLIVCTTAEREALDSFRLVRPFSSVLHVSSMCSAEHLSSALQALGGLPALPNAHKALEERVANCRINVGIKQFRFMVDMARQYEASGAEQLEKLAELLMHEGCIVPVRE